MTFSDLTRKYISAGCPDKQGVQRSAVNSKAEAWRILRLKKFFRSIPLDKISIRHCAQYGLKHCDRPRAADYELQTLANLLWFAVAEGVLTVNPVIGRARTRKTSDVRHCRDCMPKDAGEIHALARTLFANEQSESVGWQLLFECFTGCRTSEVLAMRTDASTKHEPGFVEGNYLYIRRKKEGGAPFLFLQPELRQLIEVHRGWKARRFPESPWYFPGKFGALPLERSSLTQRLRKLTGRITSHGLRAYFVTLQRSRGMNNEQVAALIGDKTAELIQTTYGALPEVWSGGEPLEFIPKGEAPAWAPVAAEAQAA